MQFLGLFGAVKGQHGEVNEHNWDWNRNYPFWNQNFFSVTDSLNGAIVAFYLAPTVLFTKPNIEVSGWLYQTKTHFTHIVYQPFSRVSPPSFTLYACSSKIACKNVGRLADS